MLKKLKPPRETASLLFPHMVDELLNISFICNEKSRKLTRNQLSTLVGLLAI